MLTAAPQWPEVDIWDPAQQPAAELPLGRSHKNRLQESLCRYSHDLRIEYTDTAQAGSSGPGSQQWLSTVLITHSKDGSIRLSAQGQGSRKTQAQVAAAAALMNLPEYETLLQQVHVDSTSRLVDARLRATHTRQHPTSSADHTSSRKRPSSHEDDTVTVTSLHTASGPLHGPAVLPAVPNAPTALHADSAEQQQQQQQRGQPQLQQHNSHPPSQQQPMDGVVYTASLVQGSGAMPPLQAAPTSSTATEQSVSAAAAAAPAHDTASFAGRPAAAAAAAGSCPRAVSGLVASNTPQPVSTFDPSWNYKNQLQETLQQLPDIFNLPVYSVTTDGPPHLQLFTATVTVKLRNIPHTTAAAAGFVPPATSAAAAAASLTATGTPQSSRKRAEQAAAAALLSMAGLQPLLHATGSPGTAALQAQGSLRAEPPKTPMQLLQELVAQAAWCMEPVEPVFKGGPTHQPVFEASVIVNGHLLSLAYGNSKKDSAQAAAARALACMQPPSPHPQSAPGGTQPLQPLAPALCSSSEVQHAQLQMSAIDIQETSLELFGQLATQAIRAGAVSPATVTQTALSTFLLQHDSSSTPQVVALGTGTGFYGRPLQELATDAERCGRVLLDCHAEVMACRSLRRWVCWQAGKVLALHKELQEVQGLDKQQAAALQQRLQEQLFELVLPSPGDGAAGAAVGAAHASSSVSAAPGGDTGGAASTDATCGVRLRLKPGVQLHMYISKPPCGDACDFSRPPARYQVDTSSSSQHFSHAKPRQQLPVVADIVPRVISSAAPQLLLPSEAALHAHWPQGCVLLNPNAAAASRGLLRYKFPGAENCSPAPTVPAPGAAAAAAAAGSATGAAATAATASPSSDQGQQQVKFCKMCCSDKMARWNALGLQGALLGQLVDPLYISSITIGGPTADFCEGAICRAICCRLAPDLPHGGAASLAGSALGGSSSSRSSVAGSSTGNICPSSFTGSTHVAISSRRLGTLGREGPLSDIAAAAVQRGLKLAEPYRVQHPTVLHAPPSSSSSSRWLPGTAGHGSSSCAVSFNWNAEEAEQLEVCLAEAGTALQLVQLQPGPIAAGPGPAAAAVPTAQATASTDLSAAGSSSSSSSKQESRLSKASFFEWYDFLMPAAAEAEVALSLRRKAPMTQQQQDTDMQMDQGPSPQQEDTDTAGQVSYAAAKARNTGYAAAKAALEQHFRHMTHQAWLKSRDLVPSIDSFKLPTV